MTGTIAIIFGLIVLVAVVALLIKQFETRMVLIGAGFLMAIAALNPLAAFDAFTKNMVAAALIQNICSTLGFAAVLKITGCDKHLIHLLAKLLSVIRPLLIPGVAIATFLINIALPSAAGCAAAVGVILIPLVISQGVSPAVAASAVMLGTFGSMLSPGLSHNPIIANLASIEVIDVIKGHTPATVASIIIGAFSLAAVAKYRKEDKNFVSADWPASDTKEKFKVNYLYAILPLIPIVMLLTFSNAGVKESISWAGKIGVPHAMIIGSFLCLLFTWTNVANATKEFFNGMGKGYGDVLGIIIAAGVFVSGLQALGLIEAFVNALKETNSIASIAATYGPFLLGVISGSGDAAALAFNNSVTPHAADFGLAISDMGSIAALAGSLGRTMSPLAGAAIICAGIAKVSPMEMAKRNAPGMIIASVVAMVIQLYL